MPSRPRVRHRRHDARPRLRLGLMVVFARQLHAGLVEVLAVPELAGHLLVLLVERLRSSWCRCSGAPPRRGRAASCGTSRDRRAIWRAAATTSASPLRSSASACSKVQMPPATTTGVASPASRTAARIARHRRDVAAERPAGVGDRGGHALVAGRTGVRVRGPADLRLLRVLELAAPRERQEVHPRARELDAEEHRVLDAVAARDAVLGEEAAADDEARADARAHGAVDLERQPHAVLARAAVAVVPRGSARRETTPSCRRARSAARRRRSPPPARAPRRRRRGRAARCGSSAMCGRSRSVTRSR